MAKTRRSGTGRGAAAQSGARWGKGLIIGGAAVAVIALLAFVVQDLMAEPPSGIPEGTQQVALEPPIHLEGRIYEDHEVPAGGPHSPIWANCGFYSEQILPEHAVHSLEHGAAWITYHPDLDETEVDALRQLARRNKVLVSPVAGQEAQLMATAWGYQLELSGADDARLEQFVNEFAGSIRYAPEPGGACSGGVGNPE